MAFDAGQYNLSSNPLSGGGTFGEGKISDANNRLQALQQALQSGQISYSDYQNYFNQLNTAGTTDINSLLQGGSKSANAANAAGAGNFKNAAALGGSDLNTFVSQFQNLTGGAPTASDISKYFTNVGGELSSGTGGAAGTNVTDATTLINNYLSQQYQPQIKGYQQQQQTDSLNQAQTQAQNLIQKQNQQTVNQLTSPQNVEAFKEAYNGSGMLDSGAFSTGLANTLGNAASGNISQALGGISIPGISNIMGTSNAPYEQFLGGLGPSLSNYGQEQNQYSQFNLQQQLAQQLGQMGQPSTLQQYAPLIQGAIQGGGALGAGQLSGKPSYLCTKLKDMGFATEREIDLVHEKVFSVLVNHPLDFLAYCISAPLFVLFHGDDFDWESLKPLIVDRVIKIDDNEEAFQHYRSVCNALFSGQEVYRVA